MANCPVCESVLVKAEQQGERFFYECPRCGPYSLSIEANSDLNWIKTKHPQSRAILSHALHKMSAGEQWALATSALLLDIVQAGRLPGPHEMLDNLILWLGEKQNSPSEEVEITAGTEAAIGAASMHDLAFVCRHAISQGLVTGNVQDYLGGEVAVLPLTLTFAGWEYFYELQRGHSTSRIAVMAMKYGDPALDAIVRDYFRPAVAATGFDLKRIDEGQPAGLIDDRMRVEIRQSRFLISDLTHENNGAYWEAGYAEGLGKPVIYTCRKDVHEATGTHFDTNHHLTVVWDPENLGEALEKLKATIRATLPEDAKLND